MNVINQLRMRFANRETYRVFCNSAISEPRFLCDRVSGQLVNISHLPISDALEERLRAWQERETAYAATTSVPLTGAASSSFASSASLIRRTAISAAEDLELAVALSKELGDKAVIEYGNNEKYWLIDAGAVVATYDQPSIENTFSGSTLMIQCFVCEQEAEDLGLVDSNPFSVAIGCSSCGAYEIPVRLFLWKFLQFSLERRAAILTKAKALSFDRRPSINPDSLPNTCGLRQLVVQEDGYEGILEWRDNQYWLIQAREKGRFG